MKLPRFTWLYPSALAYALGLFTFGIFDRRSRARVAVLSHDAPWSRSPMPVLEVAQLIGQPAKLTLLEPGLAPGNVSLVELAVLAGLVEKLQPKAIFELGTFDGRSSLNLLAHAPEEACLFTLDLPASKVDSTQLDIEEGERGFIDKPASGRRFQGTPYAPRITQLYGDSAAFDYSPYAGRMDLVFVDASHAYDYVCNDSLQALKLLRPEGGCIIWHDYNTLDWPGVTRSLNEFYHRDGRFRGLQRVEGTTLALLEVGSTRLVESCLV